MQYTCLVFAEGGRDKRFLMALIDLPKFKYHTKKWFFSYDSASGSSARVILEQCKKSTAGKAFDLVLCFIDLDDLKHDFPDCWEDKKADLENEFSEVIIIWQLDNGEDEYVRVIGEHCCGKHRINKLAKEAVERFINSDFWKRILGVVKDREEELDDN